VFSQIVAEVGACCARETVIVVTSQPAGGALEVKAAEGHWAAARGSNAAASSAIASARASARARARAAQCAATRWRAMSALWPRRQAARSETLRLLLGTVARARPSFAKAHERCRISGNVEGEIAKNEKKRANQMQG